MNTILRTVGDVIRRAATSGTFRHGFKFVVGAMLKATVHRFREILHAEPPLNPLHRVEVIFARIFLVFRPSSRIGVQGSLALLLSFSSSLLSALESSLSSGLSPFSPLSHHAANPRSFFLFLSHRLRAANLSPFLSFHRAYIPPRPVSRPRSCTASERGV